MRLSVVIATYNYATYLNVALSSILSQRYEGEMEIVLVDDGSTDETPNIATSYRRVKYIKTEHRGAAIARNIGWQEAKGEIIFFLDADDVWLPQKISYQIPSLMNGISGLVYCDTYRMTSDGKLLDKWSQHFPPLSGDVFFDQVQFNRIQTSTVGVRREVLEKVGGFNENLEAWEDIDLWCRIASRHPISYINKPLAYYRMHNRGLSRQVLKMALGELRSVEQWTTIPLKGKRRWQRTILANAYAHVGIAHYLMEEESITRQWISKAWRTDILSVGRERTLETYIKSLMGRSTLRMIRDRIRFWR